jgi:hypothetical protein
VLCKDLLYSDGKTTTKLHKYTFSADVLMYDQQDSQSQQPLDVGNNKNRDGKKKKP